MARKLPDEQSARAKSILARKVLARLSVSEKLTRAVKDNGISLSDLNSYVNQAIADVPALNKPGEGWKEGQYLPGPWSCDIVAPVEEKGETWQTIVRASDGKLYAVNFKIADGSVTIEGEPKQVEQTTDYEFVDEMEVESQADASRSKDKSSPGIFYRYSEVESSADGKRFQISFSSETPVERVARACDVEIGAAKKVGEKYLEILSHKKGDADFSDLNNDGAFLDEHDPQVQLGTIRRAVLSQDKMGRASVEFDGASELSKIRRKQFERKSRKHVSVGYRHTKFLGDEKLPDGRTAKRFAWQADEISSVAMPADNKAGVNRAKEGAFTRADDDAEMAHCLRCGEEFPRADLDDDFMCEDCLAVNRSKPALIDSKSVTERHIMADQVATITDAEVLSRAKPAIDAAVRKAETDIFARNKNFGDIVDGWVKDHGMKNRKADGKPGAEVFRSIANEFCQKDSTTPAADLLTELGNRCKAVVGDLENIQYPGMLARAGIKDYNRFAMAGGLGAGLAEMVRSNKTHPADGHLKEAHDDMVSFSKSRHIELNFNPAGFVLPDDAPSTPSMNFRARPGFSPDSFRRDMQVGVFGQGGALVPTMLQVPIIELLRNRPVLTWAGVTMLGGLSGNVAIPRQTAACAPQALAEIAQLAQTGQTFDQINFEPRRIGNQQFYSRMLLIQSSPDVEALIREDNFRQIALKIDELGLNGSGGGGEPLGIMNTPGINGIQFGGTVSYALAVQMRTLIRAQNVNDPLSFVTTSTSAGRLRSVAAALVGATTVISGPENAIWKGLDMEGSIAGTRALESQQIPGDRMICGAFEHVIWASWNGLNIVMDYVTKAANDEIGITMNTYNDFALRHPQAFTVSTDTAAA